MRHFYPCLLIGLLLMIGGPLAAQTDEADTCPPLPLNTIVEPFVYYIGIADAYAGRGQDNFALPVYTCAIEAQPEYAPAYARRGLIQTTLGNDAAALEDFNRALGLDETLLEAYLNRGIFYTRAGNYALAVGDFTLVTSFDPQNTTALQNRAMVHAIEGNFDLAMADLEQAITLNPDDPAPYAARAAIYSALALQDYQRFLDANGDPRAPLPAGTPGEVLSSVDDSLRSGNIAVWLSLLRAGQ
jgi:tetratricopeptide (TPR) repeat protein